MQLTKEILIDALAGAGFGDFQFADKMTRLGLAQFTGNQHNEEWRWRISALKELSLERLLALYREVRPQYLPV